MLRNASRKFMPPLPLRPQFRPKMGQIVTFDPKVDFRPDVKVPINVELGALPLSVGLFLGSGLSFLVRPQLPEGLPKTVALVLGAGLAVAGITNLMLPKAQAASPQVPPAPSSTPTTTAPTAPSAPGGGVSAPPGVALADQSVFNGISGQVTYPGESESVNIWPFSSSYPIRVQIYNPSDIPATFYLLIVANESPLPMGSDAKTSYPMQVTVGPGQTRDIDINMPISTWAWNVKYVDVALSVYKQRMAGDNPVLMAQRYLVVS